ncbi:helix-turn-helix domain-containing protein [Corallincola platygyrae]|uniref:Helix-turn-helix domain-containing protein n=1 Tax=Corallincola platygyrae TaxID=1193278 RepID=A0ABW4XMB6_9GAMM
MNQTKQLHLALKTILKQQQKTYADVAQCLQLSEPSVKRLFSQGALTVQRIETICSWLGTDLFALLETMEHLRPKLDQLSFEQEQTLVSDPLLLLIAVSALNFWQFEELLEHYDLDSHTLINKLAELDRMGIIELLPGNRIRILVSTTFRWLSRGPIQTFFRESVEKEFFQHGFNDNTSQLVCINGMLSDDALYQLSEELTKVEQKFVQLNQTQRRLPISQKHGTTLVMAYRRWQFSEFNKFRK